MDSYDPANPQHTATKVRVIASLKAAGFEMRGRNSTFESENFDLKFEEVAFATRGFNQYMSAIDIVFHVALKRGREAKSLEVKTFLKQFIDP